MAVDSRLTFQGALRLATQGEVDWALLQEQPVFHSRAYLDSLASSVTEPRADAYQFATCAVARTRLRGAGDVWFAFAWRDGKWRFHERAAGDLEEAVQFAMELAGPGELFGDLDLKGLVRTINLAAPSNAGESGRSGALSVDRGSRAARTTVIYRGYGGYGGTRVTVERAGIEELLQHVVRHSPSGLSWGYAGSGCAELARCILLDHFGFVESAQRNPDFTLPISYQDFKFDFVAKWPFREDVSDDAGAQWEITSEEIDEWILSKRKGGPPVDELKNCRKCGAFIDLTLVDSESLSEQLWHTGAVDDPRAPGDHDDVCAVCCYDEGLEGSET
jgi:hypothetical protein